MNQQEIEMLYRFGKMIHEKGVSNDFLLSITKCCLEHLNPLSITEYKNKYNLSYNGAKNYRKKVIILKKSYIIDNQ